MLAACRRGLIPRSALALALLPLSLPLRAEEPQSGGALAGPHLFFVPSVQLVQSFGSTGRVSGTPPLAFALQLVLDSGNWMFGGEVRAGTVRSPSLFIANSLRVDRFLQPGADAFYAGGTFGYLNEFDGEDYGGAGAYAGAQAGYLWGRSRRWVRASIELQLAIPLFGERPNKPGNYVYPFATLGVRLLI